MSTQEENAQLFQKMVVFKYAGDGIWKRSKEILVSRGEVAEYEAALTTATNHFAASDDRTQEFYFTCMPPTWRQVEISPGSWAEALPLFRMIEVRKRSKWDSSTRAVREQAAVSGPRPMQPPVQPLTERAWLKTIVIGISVISVVFLCLKKQRPPAVVLRFSA